MSEKHNELVQKTVRASRDVSDPIARVRPVEQQQEHDSPNSLDPTNADIASVLESLLAGVDADAAQAFLSIAGTGAADKAVQYVREGDHERYHYALPYPLQKLLRGLLNYAIPGKREAQFILEHQDFVSAHFRSVITGQEGMSCCADKTRTILRKLLRYYLAGEEIVFNRDAKYTFDLTEKVFTCHEDIVEFFNALQGLYYGNPKQYLAVLSKILVTP